MRWKRWAGIGCLVIVVLAALAAGGMWYMMKSSAPPITIDEPGEGGSRVKNNGMPANWYPASGEGKYPAILYLGGSEGGLWENSNAQARRLQARGYNVLYQSYYRTSDENAVFSKVPLETFDKALAWLAAQPGVDPQRIGVMGGSKGAEAALMIATQHPGIKVVVAGMPSSVVWQGFAWGSVNMSDLGSSWSRGGKPLPYLPYGEFEYGQPLAAMYTNAFKALGQHQDAVIPVEKVNGPVLLLCGEEDTLWPSCPMARQVEERAKAKGKPEVTVLAYTHAGHAVYGIPRKGTGKALEGLDRMGGTNEGNNAARADSLPKVEAFLDAALKRRPEPASEGN